MKGSIHFTMKWLLALMGVAVFIVLMFNMTLGDDVSGSSLVFHIVLFMVMFLLLFVFLAFDDDVLKSTGHLAHATETPVMTNPPVVPTATTEPPQAPPVVPQAPPQAPPVATSAPPTATTTVSPNPYTQMTSSPAYLSELDPIFIPSRLSYTSPSCAQIKIQTNQNIQNGSYGTVKVVGSVEECANLCCSDSTCQAFTFEKDKKVCRLRGANIHQSRYPDTNIDSGWKVQYPPSTLSMCTNLTLDMVIPHSCDPTKCTDPICNPPSCSPVDFANDANDKYIPKYMRVNFTGGEKQTNTDSIRALLERCTPGVTNVPITSSEPFRKIMMKWAKNEAYLTKDAPELSDPQFTWDPKGDFLRLPGKTITKSSDFGQIYKFLNAAVCFTAQAETFDNDPRFNGGKPASPDYAVIWEYLQRLFDMYKTRSEGMYDPINYPICCGPNGVYWHFTPKIWLSYKNNRYDEDILNLRVFMYMIHDNRQDQILGRKIATFEDGFVVPEWQRTYNIASYNLLYMKYFFNVLFFYAVTLPRTLFNLLIRDPLKDEVKKVVDRLTDPENHKDKFNNDYTRKYLPIHKAIDEKMKAMFGPKVSNSNYNGIVKNGIDVPALGRGGWMSQMYTILFEQDPKQPLIETGLSETGMSPIEIVYAANGVKKLHRQKGKELIVPSEAELAELVRISQTKHTPLTVEEHVCRFRYLQIFDDDGNKLPTYTGPMPCP